MVPTGLSAFLNSGGTQQCDHADAPQKSKGKKKKKKEIDFSGKGCSQRVILLNRVCSCMCKIACVIFEIM